MNEPRKLNTGAAANTEQSQYEAARRRAQEAAQNGNIYRRRTVQTNTVVHSQPAAQPMPAAEQPAAPRPLTNAQRQAIAMQQAAEQNRTAYQTPQRTVRRQGINTAQARAGSQPVANVSNRSIRQSQQAEQMRRARQAEEARAAAAMSTGVLQLDLNKAVPQKPVYDVDNDAAFEQEQQRRAAARAAHAAAAKAAAPAKADEGYFESEAPSEMGSEAAMAAAVQHGKSSKGRAKGKPAEKPAKGRKKQGGNNGNNGNGGEKKKKGMKWWQILLITLLALGLIFGGTILFILHAIAPESGGITLNQMLNTPQEFKDDEFNFVVVGIDRSSQEDLSAGGDYDPDVNDGNTDMILYVHFNNITGELKMLQIPRDTIVTTDRSFSGNYRINNIAKTQAVTANSMNIPALCEQIGKMYQVPIDGYMTIRLEMLVELVDLFNGIEMNIPFEMEYAGSYRPAGYQRLDGPAVEFVLRTRHIYPDGDIGRLNMQRQFYSALFRKLKSIGNIWDVAKLTPAILNYLETDISMSKLVSLAVSMLKIDSNKIMICQMPAIAGGPDLYYNGEAILWPARQEDADLLNTYFRENTGPVDASSLQLVDNIINLSGYPATDPNVQVMGGLMAADAEAQQNNNIDGSYEVEYEVEPAPEEPTEEGAEAAPAA